MVVQKRCHKGSTVDSTYQDNTETMIFEETEVGFQLAINTPLSSTELIKKLGDIADTKIARQIVEDTFESLDELDEATLRILEEIGRLRIELTNGNVSIVVTREEFRKHRKRATEGTSSSVSGIHFGHYKVLSESEPINSFLAGHVTLIKRTGTPPKRWSRGLMVMLKKIAGLALASRLRSILLSKADLNMSNNILFGRRMLDATREAGIIPDKHYIDKGKTVEDGNLPTP